MARGIRSLLVTVFLALGLIAPAGVMAAMPIGTASSSACHRMDRSCPKPTADHGLMGATCQVTCPAPVVLPDLDTMATKMLPSERLAMPVMGVPAGLIRAPDPFPPRSFLSA